MNKILVIAGSNGSHSINQWFAKRLAEHPQVDYLDTRELNAPYYNMDIEESTGYPQEIITLYDKIHDYGKLIIVSPEYNGYTPPFLKSITDWLSRYERFYLDGIDVVIVAVSPGQKGGASVREMLTTMLSFTNANILGSKGIPNFLETNDYSSEVEEIVNLFK
ncbi:NAD(P)H-dependent oxidoreductase [Erysipelotrichaceae bacterium OttesenSCG-928-M19]|nr:NAD(P)H-dependent oxidoreductase [Erysipelotrichaceae bacterium OttesenSCG-928-M19]